MNKFIIIVLLFATLGFAQTKNIAVSYGLTIEKEAGLFDGTSLYKPLVEKAMVDCRKLKFQLIITNDISKFYKEQMLSDDSNFTSNVVALAMAYYSGIIYSMKDKILEQHNLLGDNIFSSTSLKASWVLTSETKLIGDYLCYKATSIYRVTSGEKVFSHPVTAWYCPQIPFSFGPIGYGNLPGLILELQVRNVVYGIKNIDIDSELNFDANFLKKIKILNDKELNEAYVKLDGF
jgi:GLPGLI family protein